MGFSGVALMQKPTLFGCWFLINAFLFKFKQKKEYKLKASNPNPKKGKFNNFSFYSLVPPICL